MAPIPVQAAGPGGPPSSTASTTALVLRLLTFVCLLISVAILATNTAFLQINFTQANIRFQDVYAYRYMFGTSIVGIAYSVLQTVVTLYHISTGNQLIRGDTSLLFDFYADKIVSYILATGAAAALGATKDLKSVFAGAAGNTDKFFDKGNVCGGLVLLAFFFIAVSSVFSSFALPKRVLIN